MEAEDNSGVLNVGCMVLATMLVCFCNVFASWSDITSTPIDVPAIQAAFWFVYCFAAHSARGKRKHLCNAQRFGWAL